MTSENKDHNKNRVLGRGLSALLPTAALPTAAQVPTSPNGITVQMVPLTRIKVSRVQPRKHFDNEALAELAASIREKGLLQPLLVQRAPSLAGDSDGYELIAGERRLRACAIAGLTEVPVLIRQVNREESLELALIENIQRENLNPIEEALAYQALMDQFALTQEEIAKKVGKQRSTVANTLRLLKLPSKVQQYLAHGEITPGQARPLIALNDEQKITEYAQRIVKDQLSSRTVEGKTAVVKSQSVSATSPQVASLEEKLRRKYATKVRIMERKGKGKIELQFYNYQDLDRLLEQLLVP